MEQAGEWVFREGRSLGFKSYVFGAGDVLSDHEIPVQHAVPGDPANQAGGVTVIQVGYFDRDRQRSAVFRPGEDSVLVFLLGWGAESISPITVDGDPLS